MYLESFVYHMRDAAFAAREMPLQQIQECTSIRAPVLNKVSKKIDWVTQFALRPNRDARVANGDARCSCRCIRIGILFRVPHAGCICKLLKQVCK